MTPFLFICSLAASEIILGFIFSAIAQVFLKKSGLDFRSLLKGLIERGFLFICLINGLPHALTLFGALKVATRLKHTSPKPEDEDAFNNFYLIGNFISVIAAIGYVEAYKHFLIGTA
jgi:hypothetical protein